MNFFEKSLNSHTKEFIRNLEFIYQGFPYSFMSFKFILKHIGLFLNDFPNELVLKLLKDGLLCIFFEENKLEDNEKNFQILKIQNSGLLEELDFLSRNFLTFTKLFLDKCIKFESIKIKEYFALFEIKYLQKFLDDIILRNDISFLLSIPLKVIFIFIWINFLFCC